VSRANYLFTSESVSEGHPDKVCDRISDAVVDLYLAADPLSRVAIETLVTTNRIVMAGEVRGPESVTPEKVEAAARRAVREIGYEQQGFHWDLAEFQYYVHGQSADIARGVDADIGAQKDEGFRVRLGHAARRGPIAGDMRSFLEKELHGDVEDLRDLEQTARADAVHALLVFLYLLKRQPHALAEALLTHAKQHSAQTYPASDMCIDRVRLLACHSLTRDGHVVLKINSPKNLMK
jgi:S-adenosylmethionine synthetase